MLDRPAHLFGELWVRASSASRRRIQSYVIGKVSIALPLLRPTAAIGELDYRRVERASDLGSFDAAVGIDDVHFATVAHRFRAARQIARFVKHRKDDTDRGGADCS